MLVIFSRTLIGATRPTYFIGKLISNFTVPYCLASPENQWQEYFDPELTSRKLLVRIRYRVAWWPLHPIEFAAGPLYPVDSMVFPIFIAWALKSLILGLGGMRAYRGARPSFLG